MAGPNTLEFNDQNFEAEVLKSETPVLVDFWASWCQPCLRLAPTIDELADAYSGKVKVGKVDTEAAIQTAAKYQVHSIPTVLLFQDGEVVEKLVGLRGRKDYEEVIEAKCGITPG